MSMPSIVRRSCYRRLLSALAIVVAVRASHGPKSGWARPRSISHGSRFANPSATGNDSRHRASLAPARSSLAVRGGADRDAANRYDDDDEEEARLRRREEGEKLARYRTEQQMLYQLRSVYLTEMLASRGVPGLPTISGVSTSDGEKPPERVDWDCSLSTDDDPKSCLYSFDAEPDTKVVAPLGTDQWISLSALNRLRRTDPSKVEPMWHSRYSILCGWFADDSEFSLLQHVGLKGFLVSSVLLDGANGMVLRSLLILSVVSALVLLMPILEYVVGRILVSAPFWAQWMTWGRVVRAGFPLKLLIGQLVWKGVASCFSKVENEVRDYIVDLECEILEESVPVTTGEGFKEDMTEEDSRTADDEDLGVYDCEDEYDGDY